MGYRNILLVLVLATCGLGLSGPSAPTTDDGSIAIHITNEVPRKGLVRLALFGSEADFLQRKNPLRDQTIDPRRNGQMKFVITDLRAGHYVVAVYQDMNANNRLDENLLGIPREPYGFSVEPASKWRAPRWEEVAFQYTGSPLKLGIALRTWQER